MIDSSSQYYRIKKKNRLVILLLLAIIPVLFVLDLSIGSVEIPFKEVIRILFGAVSENRSHQIIIADTRFPQALTAISAGIGLSVCGLVLQTFFRNPLVGPSILGISSGASLGVALIIMGSAYFGIELIGLGGSSLILMAAIIGSISVLLLILLFSKISESSTTILIAGLMIAYLIGAAVQILEQLADKDELQQYVFWGFGSFAGQSIQSSYVFFVLSVAFVLPVLLLVKSLNVWILGTTYAQSLGINSKSFRIKIILVSGIVAGIVTGFCGPIAFIGLAVPHIVRRLIRTNDHLILIPAVALAGASLCLICDIIAKAPLWNSPLPLNAITSLFGAPIVIWILFRQRKMKGADE